MTIPKRDKRRRRGERKGSPPIPQEVEVKAFISPPVDMMVKNDNICKWCGRKMLTIRCQCGWVKPVNKIME